MHLFILWENTQDMKFTTVTVPRAQLRGVKHAHTAVQASPPSSPELFPQTETLSP